MPPSKRPSSNQQRAFLSCVLAPSLAVQILGCSSTETAPAPPPGSPILSIDVLRPAGGPEKTDGTCVELGRDSNKTITVVVNDKDTGQIPLQPTASSQKTWTLMPPFACVGTPACGYLLLTVDPGTSALVVASASISIDVPMARLGSDAVGDHEFRVELRTSDGSSAKDDKGNPFVVSMNVHVAERCLPGEDTDAATPPGLDSGAPDSGPHAGGPDAARGDAASPDAASPDGSTPGDASTADSGRISDSAAPPTGG